MSTDGLFFCCNAQGRIPDRVQLLPAASEVIGRDGRRWTKRDARGIADASNAFMAQHAIDENHATDIKAPRGESSPAMGWFSEVYAEPDGSVWARASWTARGRAALEAQEYRYLSPVLEIGADGEIVCVARAALTNNPNLGLVALNTTQSAPADNPVKENGMKSICVALGLPETATESDVLAAIAALSAQRNSAAPVDLAAYAPRADLAQAVARACAAEKTVAELNAAQLRARAEAAVDQAIQDRKIAPASKAEYLALCASEDGLARFGRIMANAVALVPAGSVLPSEGASNATMALNAEDEDFASAAGYTREAWLARKKKVHA